MYVRRLVLRNIKAFTDVDMAFSVPPDNQSYPEGGVLGGSWNVLIGTNGSGKTTILRCIAQTIAGPDASKLLLNNELGRWISVSASEGNMSALLDVGDEDRFLGIRGKSSRQIWSELELRRETESVTSVRPTSDLRKKGRGPQKGPWLGDPELGWFACGYGPFRRLTGDTHDAVRMSSSVGWTSSFVTLFNEGASLAEAQNWLMGLHYKSLEEGKRGENTRALEDIIGIVNNSILIGDVKIEGVESSGVKMRAPGGISLKLDDMSEGYKTLLSLLIDLLRRVRHLRVEGNKVLNSAVVLIDEIDAHLHPEWQRYIGEWFRNTFPYMQFIVTSHSPFTVQSAVGGKVFLVDSGGVSETSEEHLRSALAGTANDVYRYVFGMVNTRSEYAIQQRRRYSKLVETRKTRSLTPKELSQMESAEQFVDRQISIFDGEDFR